MVSIVIVNWNTKDHVSKAVASTHAMDHGCRTEVIVVDNASSDGSVECLRANWPELKIAAMNVNVGFGAANNVGARMASSDFLLLLNSDAKCLPTTIPAMLLEMKTDDDVGCVGARHLDTGGKVQRSTNAFPTLWNDFLEMTELVRFASVERVLHAKFPWWGKHDTRIETGWVNGACMMLRRSAFEEIGGFDEDFFLYVEEVDLCYRLQEKGWKVVFTPHAEVVHLEGGSLLDPAIRLRLRFWGHAHFYRKHYSMIRHVAFRTLVSFVAIGRISALLALSGATRFGYSASSHVRELVSYDSGSAPYKRFLGAWLAILCDQGGRTRPRRVAQVKERI